jgi:hypothetical protein
MSPLWILLQVSILFITPLASIPIMRLQLTPKELVTGTFLVRWLLFLLSLRLIALVKANLKLKKRDS